MKYLTLVGLFLGGLLIISAGGTSEFQGIVTYETAIKTGENKPPQLVHTEIFFKDKMVLVEQQSGNNPRPVKFLLHMNERVIYGLDEQEGMRIAKKVMFPDPLEMKEAKQAFEEGSKIVQTDETIDIRGYECRKTMIKNEGLNAVVYTSEDVKLPIQTILSAIDHYLKETEGMEMVHGPMPPPNAPASQDQPPVPNEQMPGNEPPNMSPGGEEVQEIVMPYFTQLWIEHTVIQAEVTDKETGNVSTSKLVNKEETQLPQDRFDIHSYQIVDVQVQKTLQETQKEHDERN